MVWTKSQRGQTEMVQKDAEVGLMDEYREDTTLACESEEDATLFPHNAMLLVPEDN